MPWTPDQERAIYTRQGSMLVSAAAGSGKTAVLVERVIHAITAEDISIDHLLVVTFTEAAAAEMRQRIATALTVRLQASPENQALARQLALLPRAQISTLHSWCLWVLRRFFYLTDLDPAFRVMDTGEDRLLQLDIFAKVLEERYTQSEPDSPFYTLVDNYSDGAGERLQELVLSLHAYINSQVFPQKWLTDCVENYALAQQAPLEELPWWAQVRQFAQNQVGSAATLLCSALRCAREPNGPSHFIEPLQQDLLLADEMAQALQANSWDKVVAACAQIQYKTARQKKDQIIDQALLDRVKDLRKQAKDILNELKSDYFTKSAAEVTAELAETRLPVEALVSLVSDFGVQYAAAKTERSLVNFADLERLCLQLLLDSASTLGCLQPSAVALQLRDYYSEILCDEYQDINPAQDAILSILAGDSTAYIATPLFVVGDVKQSIYRFRLAEPGIFLARSRDAVESSAGCLVQLSANFRCRAGVVAGVNAVFSRTMSADVGDVDYNAAAALVYAADYPPLPGEGDPAPDIKLLLLEGNLKVGAEAGSTEQQAATQAMEMDTGEREALCIAQAIRKVVGMDGPGVQVWDKSAGAYRPACFRDIAILLRAANTKAGKFSEVFRQAGVPLYVEAGSGYFQTPEIVTMLALLALIDNPRQDLPLAGVLRSPIVGLRGADLLAIRTAGAGDYYDAVVARSAVADALGRKLTAFLANLDAWRTKARQGGLGSLVWSLYEETCFYDYIGGLPGGEQRQANLRALYERACQFDQFARQGLLRFLQFINDLRAGGEDLGQASALGENENVVRLLSIHKSKGLEFPVVFVAGLGAKFNMQDLRGGLLFDRTLGIGAQAIDAASHTKAQTLASMAVRCSLRRSTLSEEMRILYVALTRAREKLYLVGTVSDMESHLLQWEMIGTAAKAPARVAPAHVAAANCYLDWLLPALYGYSGLVPPPEAGLGSDVAVAGDDTWEVQVYPAAAVCRQFVLGADDAGESEVADEVVADVADKADEAEAFWTQLRQQLTWEYPQRAATLLPAKISVTEIKRRTQEALADSATPGKPAPEAVAPTRWRRPELSSEQKLSAVQIGSATHLVLQRLSLVVPLTADTLAVQVADLVAQDCLTAAEGEHVDQRSIIQFAQSSLGKRLWEAQGRGDAIYREVPFVVALPAGALVHEPCAEEVVLQGVADCLFAEADGWVLLDFKTDKLSGSVTDCTTEAVRRYGSQLHLYQQALQQVLNIHIKEAYIYLLTHGLAIPVGAADDNEPLVVV